MIRTAIFEDNDSFRGTLTWLLAAHGDMSVTGTYPDARQAVERVMSDSPDVVLMDIQMPGVSGIEAVRKIREACPDVRILMLTSYEDTDKIFDAITAGAVGYILKKTPGEKIVEAIREVHAGGAAMTPSVALKVMASFQQAKPRQNPYLLTEKEQEVLARLVAGDSYKLIAANLDISLGTVHTHILHIYQKLHVNSKGEAITKALRNGLV
ncbi:MAG: response regulator transcription factor [Siphonobacter aquaeclarae]|nr:response regulator transcription factor [Siphonobacter aquaeclarae]